MLESINKMVAAATLVACGLAGSTAMAGEDANALLGKLAARMTGATDLTAQFTQTTTLAANPSP